MDIAKKIRMACTAAGISESELARRIETSPQKRNQRLKVGKFTGEELEKIAAALNAEFIFAFRFNDGTTV